MLEFITARDYSLMRRVHHWPAPRWIRVWMLWATRGGDGWLWDAWAYHSAVRRRVSVRGSWRRGHCRSGHGHRRVAFPERTHQPQAPCAIEPHCSGQTVPPDRFSFPSGHTITAFAVAVSLSSFYPGLLIGLLFCAGSIALWRILLGMHFLSDVIAGALLGSGLAYGAVWLLR